MKTRRKRLLVIFCFLIGAGLAAFLSITQSGNFGPAPSYRGTTLWVWIDKTPLEPSESEEFRVFGSNAVPHLVRRLEVRATAYDRFPVLQWPSVKKHLLSLGAGPGLTQPGNSIRSGALNALSCFANEVPTARRALADHLLKADRADLKDIAFAIVGGNAEEEAVEPILTLWRAGRLKRTPDERHLLACVFRAPKTMASRYRPLIKGYLQPGPDGVEWEILASLVNWSEPAPELVPFIVPLISSTNAVLAHSAVRALGIITNRCDQVVPVLLSYINDSSNMVSLASAMTLWRHGYDSEFCVQHLASLVEDEKVRSSAARELGRIGPSASNAVPILRKYLQRIEGTAHDLIPWERSMVALALIAIEGATEESWKEIAKGLAYKENPWVEESVALDVAKLGATAKPMIPFLEQKLSSPHYSVRRAAREALRQIRSDE